VTTPPPRIHEAMRYSLMAGGKRLRPILVLAAGEVFGGAPERLYPVACAFEMVHTYSLIHDDLPAMDNDDLRRGMPTCHKQFDEATAILAGDGLMTHAFRILAEMDAPAEQKVRVIRELAVGSGTVEGMIAGQIVDLEAEGKPIDAGRLAFIHRAKTGALIRGALVCGGIVADATESDLALLSAYGDRVGLAFQIADDILDETATAEQLGKTPGKDAAAGKATYPALYGLEASRKQAESLAEEAIEVLAPLGQRAELLIAMARFVVHRTS